MINTPFAFRFAKQLGRRGMSVIVVLGIISITLALSYAMLRAQVTSVEIQSNLERRNLARQAAYAGISAALRKMHDASWGGVGLAIEQDLADHQWFEVTFETGDDSLINTDPEWNEYPFRVTIHAVGHAEDPSHPEVQNTYRVDTVVELVRKKLHAEPATWPNVRNYTAYQYSGNASFTEVPVRVEGPMWMQGLINVGSDYPVDPTSRSQYFSDLTAMKNASLGDYRPFSGPITTPLSKQTAAVQTFLAGQQVTLTNTAIATAVPGPQPSGSFSYQLYPGGKSYELPTLQLIYGNTLSNVTLSPNPQTNPLGIYLSKDLLTLGNNVNITGTIVTTSGSEPDIRITGTNVTLQGATLPYLQGSTTPYQLPVAIVKDDFQVLDTADCVIRGAVMAYDEFSFIKGASTTKCDLQGRVICSKLFLNGRAPWDLTLLQWQTEYLAWLVQKLDVNGVLYYPQWIKQKRTFDPNPLLTIKPAAAEIVHHWHTWGQPVYVAHGDDNGGLRWNLIDWTDNPAN